MSWAGFGIAGNFAGHLEQAGEARDFAALKATGAGPKGMFPFYLPLGQENFLSVDPLSSHTLNLPAGAEIQPEPEMALRCKLEWTDGRARVIAISACSFDDASIRREGAPVISVKKNWGPGSKGISEQTIAIDTLSAGGVLDNFRLASFLYRDGQWTEFGEDSSVKGYTLFHDDLLPWIEDRLNGQKPEGPLEDLPALLAQANLPQEAIITIGATRYNSFGETLRVQANDRVAVILYRPDTVQTSGLVGILQDPSQAPRDGISLLIRDVVAV
jgi:hypothetical protein